MREAGGARQKEGKDDEQDLKNNGSKEKKTRQRTNQLLFVCFVLCVVCVWLEGDTVGPRVGDRFAGNHNDFNHHTCLERGVTPSCACCRLPFLLLPLAVVL